VFDADSKLDGWKKFLIQDFIFNEKVSLSQSFRQ